VHLPGSVSQSVQASHNVRKVSQKRYVLLTFLCIVA
jgi:hypothetical protein